MAYLERKKETRTKIEAEVVRNGRVRMGDESRDKRELSATDSKKSQSVLSSRKRYCCSIQKYKHLKLKVFLST